MTRHAHLQTSLLRRLLLLFLTIVTYATYVSSYTDISSSSPASSSSEDIPEAPESTIPDTVCLSDNVEFSCPAPAPATPVDPHDRHIVFVSIAIKGHALPLLRVASEMKERGYRVSFATHDSGREWAHAYGVPFLSAGAFPISAEDLRVKLRAMTRDASNFRGILTMFNDIYVRAARPMFEALLPQLESNGTNTNAPDLLVMDIATVGAQDLAHKLKIPYILNSPSLLFDLGGAPSYVPAWGTGFRENMSLWNRCMNILFPRLLSVALTPPFMELNKVRYELDLPPFRSQHDLFKGARVILNTAFGLEHPQPISPLVDAVGPIMPVPGGNASKLERQPLPAALLSWLDASIESTPSLRLRQRTASHPRPKSVEHDLEAGAGGVVYVNLGTMAYIDAWQAQALVEGLLIGPGDPPVKVLWVLPTDQRGILPPALPTSLVLKPPSSSLSNLEILSHPAVRLVVSHCGMLSAQEALVMGKPLLCIPFLVDQPDVAARVADSGAGFSLDKNLLSGPYVHAAVTELLTNASYTRSARKVGALLERAGGTFRAIDVIDAALRLGFDHLATLNLTAPWHKTALLDVWAVYAALICLLAVFVRVQWLLLYFLVSESFNLLCNLVLGPPLPPSSMAEGYDEAYEDGEEAEGAAVTHRSPQVDAVLGKVNKYIAKINKLSTHDLRRIRVGTHRAPPGICVHVPDVDE